MIAEYEVSSTPSTAREYVYGNGIDEILCMFTPYHAGDPEDWDAFAEICEAWLSSENDPNTSSRYDENYDHDNDGFIDLEDFAYWASVWDMPSGQESNWYYLRDALGSVRGLIGGRFGREDDWEFYNYDVYGKLSITNPEESQSGNPYLFAGYRFDPETGLYNTHYRTYDPETGRWLQFDPMGYTDRMDLYEYARSNPLTYIDPFGDYPWDGIGEPHWDHNSCVTYCQYILSLNPTAIYAFEQCLLSCQQEDMRNEQGLGWPDPTMDPWPGGGSIINPSQLREYWYRNRDKMRTGPPQIPPYLNPQPPRIPSRPIHPIIVYPVIQPGVIPLPPRLGVKELLVPTIPIVIPIPGIPLLIPEKPTFNIPLIYEKETYEQCQGRVREKHRKELKDLYQEKRQCRGRYSIMQKEIEIQNMREKVNNEILTECGYDPSLYKN